MRIYGSIVLCLLLLSTCISSQNIPGKGESPEERLKEKIEYYKNRPLFRTGIWSIHAEYLDDQQPVYSLESSKVCATGSNMKIITCAAALEILGPDFTYYTDIFYKGDIAGEILDGEVYIRGSGDPAFLSGIIESAYKKEDISRLLYRELKSRGINQIRGGIIADNLLFSGNSIPDDWRWLDLGTHYGTGTSALCMNENMATFSFKATPSQVTFLDLRPEIPYLKLVNHIISGNPDTPFYYHFEGLPKFNTITIHGNIPADNRIYVVKAAIPEPALLAAFTISNEIKIAGISISGQPSLLDKETTYDYEKKLLTIPSPRLGEITYYLFKKSINLYAEQLCITLGLRKYGIASTKNGVRALTAFLEDIGMPMEGIKIYDGCGLSRYNKINTRLIVCLLKHMAGSHFFSYFYDGFGVAGDPDDISFFTSWGQGTEMAYNARIKSGSLKLVKAHSGYVATTSGRMIAYSMIANSYNGTPSDVEEVHRDIILSLAQLD